MGVFKGIAHFCTKLLVALVTPYVATFLCNRCGNEEEQNSYIMQLRFNTLYNTFTFNNFTFGKSHKCQYTVLRWVVKGLPTMFHALRVYHAVCGLGRG